MDRRTLLPSVAAAVLAAGLIGIAPSPASSAPAPDDPQEIVLTGVVRDFKQKSVAGGHVDFENQPNRGFGHYIKNVAVELGGDRKPMFVGGGAKVVNQWKNSAGKQICYALFNPSLGDVAGSHEATSSTGGITSSESFKAWFNDTLGVNLSKTLDLKLVRQSNGSYVFDSQVDPLYKSLGGFFPIENELYGNSGVSPNRNFHFTFELHTEFTYDAASNQVFSFRGDDDVWVFINDKLVIDLGGVHGAVEQVVDLNRLGLTDGETYKLDFFFAERHTTQSNFKVTTNLRLETVSIPTVTNAYD